MQNSRTVYFFLSIMCFICCSYFGDFSELVTSFDTKEGVTADPGFLNPDMAIADKICAVCAFIEAPANEWVAKFRECTAQVMMVNSTNDPAWCTAASGTGTYSRRVEMPRPTWTRDIPVTAVKATRVALGKDVQNAPPAAVFAAAYMLQMPPSVAIAKTRWSNWTVAVFSKKFLHIGWISIISEGIHSSPIIGQVLKALPASLPATNAPDRTVVATRTPFPMAAYRIFLLRLRVLDDNIEATDLDFSGVLSRLKPGGYQEWIRGVRCWTRLVSDVDLR